MGDVPKDPPKVVEVVSAISVAIKLPAHKTASAASNVIEPGSANSGTKTVNSAVASQPEPLVTTTVTVDWDVIKPPGILYTLPETCAGVAATPLSLNA